MGSGTLLEITDNTAPRRPHMQMKALSCKEEAVCEQSPGTLRLVRAEARLKWSEAGVFKV